MISLDSVTCLQPDQVVGPESMKIEISGCATSAIARHAGFAAVGIENSDAEVCVFSGGRGYGDAISARAVMPIANAFREAAEVVDFCELFRFKDEVIISEALKFCESHIWSAPAERSATALWIVSFSFCRIAGTDAGEPHAGMRALLLRLASE